MDKFIYACFILQLSSINHHNCIMQRDGFIHMGTELWRIRKLRFFSTEFSRKFLGLSSIFDLKFTDFSSSLHSFVTGYLLLTS